jgi:hypothetical protein
MPRSYWSVEDEHVERGIRAKYDPHKNTETAAHPQKDCQHMFLSEVRSKVTQG